MIEKPPSRRHVRHVLARGKWYAYFIVGRSEDGNTILTPLPRPGSPEFEPAYQAALATRPPLIEEAKRISDGKERAAQRLAKLPPPKQFVYFIVSSTGEIKIGTASRPLTRLRKLQTGHHAHLTLMATVEGGVELEREYHQRFAQHRIRGEWFYSHPDIWREINRLIPNENVSHTGKPRRKQGGEPA